MLSVCLWPLHTGWLTWNFPWENSLQWHTAYSYLYDLHVYVRMWKKESINWDRTTLGVSWVIIGVSWVNITIRLGQKKLIVCFSGTFWCMMMAGGFLFLFFSWKYLYTVYTFVKFPIIIILIFCQHESVTNITSNKVPKPKSNQC